MKNTNMKIILEGVDGSGKTTLARKIQEAFPDMNFKIVHLTSETPNNRVYLESLLFSKDNIIFDRFHIGQFIYQTEEQRKDKGWMTQEDLKSLENTINHMKAIVKIIYVDTNAETCLINCKNDFQDSHYTLEYIQALQLKYKEFIKNSNTDIMIYHNDFAVSDPSIAQNFNYKSLPRIVAVDFDGCLATDCFPRIENAKPNLQLIEELAKARREENIRLVLWTCRTDESLSDAVEFCKKYGLEFDAVNDNVKELKDVGLNPRKIYCDEYIDDKARYCEFK